MITKNRGATSNPEEQFEKEKYEKFDNGWDSNAEDESLSPLETTLFKDNAKTVITRNDSPDIGFE